MRSFRTPHRSQLRPENPGPEKGSSSLTSQSIGIFAKTFPRGSLESNLDAAAGYGLQVVHYNMACAGLPSVPDEIPSELATRVGRAAAARGVRIAAVSGTFNMIHPDPELRRRGLRGLRAIAGACAALGTGCITLCTGTRDAAFVAVARRFPDTAWSSRSPGRGDLALRRSRHSTEMQNAIAAFLRQLSDAPTWSLQRAA